MVQTEARRPAHARVEMNIKVVFLFLAPGVAAVKFVLVRLVCSSRSSSHENHAQVVIHENL